MESEQPIMVNLSAGPEGDSQQVQPTSMTKERLEAAVAEVAPPQAPKPRTKVAILGFTDTWKLAPFNDPEWEVWGLNELYLFIPRWDRWFEIHSRRLYEQDRNRTHEHIIRLQQMNCPIYMQQHWDDIPNSVAYPLQAVSEVFPNPAPFAPPYLNNSISYMIALAMLEGFEEIGIYGVDMQHDSEYHNQRPSCEYFIGLAQGRGIKVYVPPQADLLKTLFLYGYQDEQAQAFEMKLKGNKDDLQNKWNQMNNELAQKSAAREQYAGAIQQVEHILKIWKQAT